MKKQLLFLFAALLPMLASAQTKVEIDGIWYNLDAGTKQAEVTYKGSSWDAYSNEYSGTINLPATVTYEGVSYSVISIGEGTFGYCSLTAITIPESVTSIGDFAFYSCWRLTAITLPESVTSIGKYAFSDCSSLTAVTIPEGVTSIEDCAFFGCSSLTAITLPEGVTSIRGLAFCNCSSLTAITIPEGVTWIGEAAFDNCTALKEVIFEDGSETLSLHCNNYYSGGTGQGLFYDCPLESVYLGRNLSYDTSRYYGYSPFYNNTKLTSVIIGDGVTSIGEYAFYNCRSLTAITIPEGVTSIGNYAFDNCTALKEVIFEDGSETLSLGYNYYYSGSSSSYIGQGLFYDCPLESVYLGRNLSYSSGSFGYSPFYNKTELTSLVIGDCVTSIGNAAFYGCSNLTAITIPEGVTSIGYYAFYECSSLTAITIPEGVTSIESDTFYGCSSLTAITLPEGVTSIGSETFYGCSSLTAITLPESVTSIGDGAFYGCSSLTAITIPEGVTSIGNNAFYECSCLTAVHISDIAAWCNIKFSNYYSNPLSYAHNLYLNGELVTQLTLPESVTSIGEYTFSGCSSLTSIILPESVTSIKEYAFYGCSSLTAITLPESVTCIGEYTFSGCSSLTAITIPEGVTSIGDYAFRDCTALKEIIFEDGSETLSLGYNYYDNGYTTGQGLFYDCPLESVYLGRNLSYSSGSSYGYSPFYYKTELTSVLIGDGVTSIGSWAFYDCSSLTDVYCYAEGVPTTQTNAFDNSNIKNATLHVPANALNAYKTTAPWSSFGKFETIETLVEGITLSQSSATLTEGETLRLTATVKPTNATNKSITWSSSNTSVATVDANGKVTAKAAGTATITATANDGSGVNASCVVTVEKKVVAVSSITLSQSLATLIEGGTLTLTATVTPDDATNKAVTWSSSNTSVATVDANGKVTAIAPGTATITATANDGSGVSATCEVTVVAAEYTITYYVDGEVYHQETLTRGTAIVPIKAPTKDGHTFSGWSEIPETMPAEEVKVYGTFAINSYLVTFKIDDKVFYSESLPYGAEITAPEAPEKEGHTFTGWGEVDATVPAHDVTYWGTYTVNTYCIYYYVGRNW